MITLETVTPENRELLFNLHQKYLYEMTNYYDNEIDASGNIHYAYFDAYFTDPARTALLIRRDGVLAGYAMINPYSYFKEHPDHVLAEFTVFPKYRRKHTAEEAAALIFEAYPGSWEIKYNEKNTAAKQLWNKVTAVYQPRKVQYAENETVLVFTTENTKGTCR